MTFDELDKRFPNGMVDAEISALTLNYQDRTAVLHLNLRGNSPDSPDSQEYRQAVLTLDQFYYLSIEPPDPEHLSYPLNSTISVDGLPEDPNAFLSLGT